jgi:hypothetical protein
MSLFDDVQVESAVEGVMFVLFLGFEQSFRLFSCLYITRLLLGES